MNAPGRRGPTRPLAALLPSGALITACGSGGGVKGPGVASVSASPSASATSPDGGLHIQFSPGGDLDPNNPRFKAAHEACKQCRPGGGAGGSLNTGGAS